MAVDYLEVMGLLGSITAKHPQTMSLAMQTVNLWNQVKPEASKAQFEYQKAAPDAHNMMDTAGILMQIAAGHPSLVPFLKQVLTMWQTRIPDLLQILDEFQAGSGSAAKT